MVVEPSDQEAEAAFARRAGLDPRRGNAKFVMSWWWYALITFQFWFHLTEWALGARGRGGTTGWAIFSSLALIVGTPAFFLARRRELRRRP